jgi:hypothetical protein
MSSLNPDRDRPVDLPSANVSTYDAARALHLTPAGVRHLIAAELLPCRRLPSGRREIPRAAVLTLAAQRARAGLELVPRPIHKRQRTDAAPTQLRLFHVRPAKAALQVREAKEQRSGRKSA